MPSHVGLIRFMKMVAGLGGVSLIGRKLFPGKQWMVMVIILFILIPSKAYGGDSLYRMLYADEVASLGEDQDAVVLFEVVSVGDHTFKAKVLHVVTGEVVGETITVSKENIEFLGMLPDPDLKTGDYCVMSVKRYGDLYKKVHGALKADSGDYRSLKFYYSSHFSDIDALQYFVNSGGVEKDFYFDGSQVFVRLKDGGEEEVTLSRTGYLPEDHEPVSEEVSTPPVETINTTDDNPELAEGNGLWLFRVSIISVALMVALGGFLMGKRWRG